MEQSGLLTEIVARNVILDNGTFFLRKSADPAKFVGLVGTRVTVEFEEDKGFQMVKDIKPEIPVTAVEKTPAQPSMPPSQTMTSADMNAKGAEFVQKAQPRSQKDLDIMFQWSLGQATSPTWANCNDALVLSTEQMKNRIRDLSAWYRNEVLGR